MERADVLARRAARFPERIAPQPLLPGEAAADTARARSDAWWSASRSGRALPRGDWCLVGWVGEPDAEGAWAVWWSPATDRVWLRADHGRPWVVRLEREWLPETMRALATIAAGKRAS